MMPRTDGTQFQGMLPLLVAGWTAVLLASPAWAAEPVAIGSRLELFVDDFLIDQLTGDAHQELQKPKAGEVVLVADEPWEGNTSAYYTVFQDGPLYRMYYRGSHFDTTTRKATHPEVACYAQSTDGVTWTKPELGLFEFKGSKANNIVWRGLGGHNFTPFLDTRPDCPAESKYKAMGHGKKGSKRGLFAFESADGVRWKLMADEPVVTKGAFDSQNLAFWDTARNRYVEFHRGFRDGLRDIMWSTSDDFLTWTEPVWLEYSGAPREHLYTNAILAYDRAPHLLLGFPTRYHPERNSQVEPTLMSSRDGSHFHRWKEALIPVTAPEDRDGNRSNYMAWGIVSLPGNEKEQTVYATEAYYTGPDSRLRGFTYRTDGFVSIRASAKGGELRTKPLVFDGKQLRVNFTTSGSGSLRVEIQDAAGKPIDGFSLAECPAIQGDSIEELVTWKGGSNLARLAGSPVRLRFVLQDADLYALRFEE